MNDYLRYFTLGLTIFSPSVVGLLLGLMLDKVFKTFPLLTFIFLVLGIISGIWSMYKTIKGVTE